MTEALERDQKIMRRLAEHLDSVKDKHPEWVGIFLQGSQNYTWTTRGATLIQS